MDMFAAGLCYSVGNLIKFDPSTHIGDPISRMTYRIGLVIYPRSLIVVTHAFAVI